MNCIIEMNDYWSEIDLSETEFMPAGGLAAAVNQERNTAYIYGGSALGNVNNNLYEFDLNSEKIKIFDKLSVPDRLNNKLYYLKGDKLCIVSGATLNNKDNPESIELLVYDLKSKTIEKIDTRIPFRGQFGSAFDFQSSTLYLYNGFNMNDYYSIKLDENKITKIDLFQTESRAGMVCEFINPNTFFIFSGFSRMNGKSICHNDYKLVNTENFSCQTFECKEPFGRTFSKSVLIESLNKILIFGGSPNGMESSGSIYFYDYNENLFNIAYIQPLPGERVEPAMIYSIKNNKVYIISGFSPNGRSYEVHKNIMVLNLNLLPIETWLGHP